MPLIPCGDGYLSDSIADALDWDISSASSLGRINRDSVLHGALFTFALALLLAIKVMLSPAKSFKPISRKPATHLRITHLFMR